MLGETQATTIGPDGVEIIFALLDPDHKSAGMTLSNGNRTVDYAVINPPPGAVYLDQLKTTGIWSFETTWTPDLQAGSIISTLHGWGDTRDVDENIGVFLRSQGVEIRIGTYYKNFTGSVVTVGNFATSQTSSAANPHLMLMDFAARKLGFVKAGAVVWTDAMSGTNQLYAGISAYMTVVANNLSMTINTGQEPFSATNKALLATVAGANEGFWI